MSKTTTQHKKLMTEMEMRAYRLITQQFYSSGSVLK